MSLVAGDPTPSRRKSLFPREHGAYGQLAFPLMTALAIASVSAAALLFALSAVAGFLMHEPLLVLIGRRGVRAQRERRRAALVNLVAASAIAIVAGVLGFAWATAAARASLVLPLIPAAVLGLAIAIGYEKRALGEIAAALSFSFMSVPIALAGGASAPAAFSVAIAFASIFVTATLAVRVVVLRVRGGGNPRAERATRIAVVVLSVAIVAALAIASRWRVIPWATIAASTPGLVGATWLSMLPPAPARLRTIGWTLVAASALAAVVLIVGL